MGVAMARTLGREVTVLDTNRWDPSAALFRPDGEMEDLGLPWLALKELGLDG